MPFHFSLPKNPQPLVQRPVTLPGPLFAGLEGCEVFRSFEPEDEEEDDDDDDDDDDVEVDVDVDVDPELVPAAAEAADAGCFFL